MAPAWLAVKVLPAMVRVPAREEAEEFAVTEKFTVLLPVPLPLEVRMTQAVLLTVVQGQPAPVVRLMDPVPEEEPKDWEAGERE